MKNAFVLALALLVTTSVFAHAGASAQCTFNSDCADPLVCAGGFCRIQCKTDRDCVNGWTCRPLRLMDVAPGSAVPQVDETQNRCVAPGTENLARVVVTSRGVDFQYLPVTPTHAPITAVPAAGSQGANPGYAVPQGSTLQVPDAPTQRTGTPVLQAPVVAANPGLNLRRVHRAGLFEFQRGEHDDFLYMRTEGGAWSPVGAGELTSEPAAIVTPNKEVYVFGKGKDDAIWGVRCQAGVCGDWFSLGGVLTSGPTVTIESNGKLRVTATGTDGRPWFITGDGQNWFQWSPQ